MNKFSAIIADIVEPAIATKKNLGVVIAVIQADCASVCGFGQINGTEKIPGGTTIYEIGSVTKVFTSTLLACLVNEGTIKLDDSVCNFLSELPQFPPAITLRHLATHTSGLPRLPKNLWRSVLKNFNNPYAAYTSKDLYAYLRKFKLTAKIGQFNYSNLGMGLLGQVLERITQKPYEQLIKQYITHPLGLSDTCITLTDEQQQRLAPGHTDNGKLTSNWDLPTLAGAGALRSTGDDLLKFLDANIHTEISHLQQAFESCHTMQIPEKSSNDKSFISGGLGWFIVRLNESEDPILWHNGATGGYQSYLGLIKGRCLGIVVLANHGIGNTDRAFADVLGDRIFTALLARV
ncbi:MAG: beta-lactamase family protein [Microcoleus sp. CSU_2_2]|nr:beta-lactamase family protein [Microcoleus sp. CSU_2_2]